MSLNIFSKENFVKTAKDGKDIGEIPIIKAEKMSDIHELADNLPKGCVMVIDIGGRRNGNA